MIDPTARQLEDGTRGQVQNVENPQHVKMDGWRTVAIIGICLLVVVGLLAAVSLLAA